MMHEGVVALAVDGFGRTVGVGGLSENGGKLEMVPGYHEGLMHVVGYDFPGGAVENGEDIRGAIVREVGEEFGIPVSEERFRRVIPERVQVLQYREYGAGWGMVEFVVVCFALQISEIELDTLMRNGGVLVEDSSFFRPRDQAIYDMARGNL